MDNFAFPRNWPYIGTRGRTKPIVQFNWCLASSTSGRQRSLLTYEKCEVIVTLAYLLHHLIPSPRTQVASTERFWGMMAYSMRFRVGLKFSNLFLESHFPLSTNRFPTDSPSINKIIKTCNNFLTITDKQKILLTTEIGVKQSTCNTTHGLGRPVMAKFAFTQFSYHFQTSITLHRNISKESVGRPVSQKCCRWIVSDVIFGLRSPLAADFAFAPLCVNGIRSILSLTLEIHSQYVLNPNKKLWSLYRMVTAFPVCWRLWWPNSWFYHYPWNENLQ